MKQAYDCQGGLQYMDYQGKTVAWQRPRTAYQEGNRRGRAPRVTCAGHTRDLRPLSHAEGGGILERDWEAGTSQNRGDLR